MSEIHDEADEASSRPAINWDAVARLYDTYVTATFDVPFYQRVAAGACDVLELMCGTGRLSLPLAESGVQLTCVDVSAEMLAVLREKLARRPELVSNVRIVQADVRELALGRQFDLVLLPFQSLAELVTVADRERALTRMYEHVCDGGRFVCTLHNPVLRRRSADGLLRLVGKHRMPGREATLLVWALASYDPASRLVEGVQLYEEYGASGVLDRKQMLEMRFALPDRAELETLAVKAGFRVAAFYGDYDETPFHEEASPFMIWIFEKVSRLPGSSA